MSLTNIEMKRASLELHTTSRNIFYAKYQCDAGILSWTSIEHELRHAQRRRGVFMAKKETLLSLANVHAVNERGQSSVDIDRINHHIVNVEKINFRLPERRE